MVKIFKHGVLVLSNGMLRLCFDYQTLHTVILDFNAGGSVLIFDLLVDTIQLNLVHYHRLTHPRVIYYIGPSDYTCRMHVRAHARWIIKTVL